MTISRGYRLHGPQVEPTASFWLDSPAIRVSTLTDVQGHAESAGNQRLYLDPNLFPNDDALEREFAFLKVLEERRKNAPYRTIPFN